VNRRTVSLTYLVLQTLALIEYSAFMSGAVLFHTAATIYRCSLEKGKEVTHADTLKGQRK